MLRPAAPETGVILRVRLPRRLEALRRQELQEAGRGLPAHVTLLYPFVAAGALDPELRESLAQVVSSHRRFVFRLVGPATWPDVLYASVEPRDPLRSLQADLAAAFPDFPVYGGAFDFEPHVTIAEGLGAARPELAVDPAWASLPRERVARSVELISLGENGWRTKWRFPLRPAVTVLVCGEGLRGDDAAALLAAGRLPANVRAFADIVEVGQLSVEALLDVPDGVAVIVADAAVGVAPGRVVTMPLSDVAAHAGGARPGSSHSLPPDQVLALAEELRGSPINGTFIGMGGAEFGHGQRLSPAVEGGVAALAAELAREIRRLAVG